MTFVRKKNKTFKWPVLVREPSETDAGVYEENEFIAIFKRLKVSEYQNAADNKSEFELLKMMLQGWENMKEENGEDIPFNNQNLKDMMEDAYWLRAVSDAYTKSLMDEKVKN
jgi:hypothetical protein|tara:strand:- start:312 stop:647 length:336 start_codon:yes stop_codon:yes gene_type:complete